MVGVDVSEEAVAQLQQLGIGGILVGDAHEIDLPRRFDTVVAGELIEHLGRPESFLRSAARHLKDGGRIVITTPYPFGLLNFLYALKNFPRTCSNPQHTMWFCPSTLEELARRAGLRIERWRLIVDLQPGSGSLPYRAFVAVMHLIGRFIPRRLRCNAMLFVLVPDGSAPALAQEEIGG